METCPFCNFSEAERVVEEGTLARVIFSNPRLMPGHLLVIPRRHCEKLADLSAEEREEIMGFVAKYEEKILSTVAPGCDIRQHYRPFIPLGPLKVDHLHFHLLPRSLEDVLYQQVQIHEKELFVPLLAEEAEKLRELWQ